MTSAAQIAANLANAQHSTGPTTFEGKTRSAENARKFGFYSKQAVLLKIGGFGDCSKGKAASSGAASSIGRLVSFSNDNRLWA